MLTNRLACTAASGADDQPDRPATPTGGSARDPIGGPTGAGGGVMEPAAVSRMCLAGAVWHGRGVWVVGEDEPSGRVTFSAVR